MNKEYIKKTVKKKILKEYWLVPNEPKTRTVTSKNEEGEKVKSEIPIRATNPTKPIFFGLNKPNMANWKGYKLEIRNKE